MIDIFPNLLSIYIDEVEQNNKTLNLRTNIIVTLFSKLQSSNFEEVDNVVFVLNDILQKQFNLDIVINNEKIIIEIIFDSLKNKIISNFNFEKTIHVINLLINEKSMQLHNEENNGINLTIIVKIVINLIYWKINY